MSNASLEVDHGAVLESEGRTDFNLGRRLFSYLIAHKRLFFIALLLYPITAAMVVLPPFLIRQILDESIPNRDTRQLAIYGGLYVGAVALEYFSGFASQFAMSVLGQRAMRTLRGELFEHVQRLPASFFDKNPIGRTLTRLTNDVEALGEVFATGAVTVVSDLISVAAVVAMMLWLDVRLTLFSFLVVPPLLVLTLIFRKYARRAFRAIRKHLARINTFLAEHISGMSVVQLFRQEQATEADFLTLNDDYRNANRTAIAFDALLFAIVEAIGTAAVAAMIWYGAVDFASGAVGAGTLVAFIQYIRRFFIPIRDLSTKYTVLQSAFAAAERIFLLFDEQAQFISRGDAKRVTCLKRDIELRDVSFSYRANPGQHDWVLRDLSLTIERGEKVALVGATGSGKTTLLKLINRSYDVNKGSILVDGVDVRDIHLQDLRRLFAVVLQDVYLFSGDVMQNLTLAGEVRPEEVKRAAVVAQAHSFIQRLPQGYKTSVRELGSNFSAGERQLLAFARALARDPQILVLDEATSNVDSETEAGLQKAMDALLENRTALIVAHRLSTVRKMDRILVLQAGRLVEEGDHESLMAKGGVYQKLAALHFGESSIAPAPLSGNASDAPML